MGRNMADLSGFEPRLCAVAYIYYIYHSSYFAVTSSLSPFKPPGNEVPEPVLIDIMTEMNIVWWICARSQTDFKSINQSINHDQKTCRRRRCKPKESKFRRRIRLNIESDSGSEPMNAHLPRIYVRIYRYPWPHPDLLHYYISITQSHLQAGQWTRTLPARIHIAGLKSGP